MGSLQVNRNGVVNTSLYACFKEELLKTAKFADDEDAEKVIRSMFKEGLIYESKPGFFRRVGS